MLCIFRTVNHALDFAREVWKDPKQGGLTGINFMIKSISVPFVNNETRVGG